TAKAFSPSLVGTDFGGTRSHLYVGNGTVSSASFGAISLTSFASGATARLSSSPTSHPEVGIPSQTGSSAGDSCRSMFTTTSSCPLQV
ncbi:hypothetical protein BJV78DRAFT_1198317, partial [Lactifluus subvellereus]